MRRGRAATRAAAPLAACARHAPPPPAPPPTAEVVRRNPWLAHHFDELTPPQQARVAQRLRRARPPRADTPEEARRHWDATGLEERRALIAPVAGRPRVRATAAQRPSGTGGAAPAATGGAGAMGADD
ncbi:hypothetical protein [Caldovatus aquaticus]|uniref:DUF3106 domain-containing protein n=1 Tax=Caldovatus aquaticus TaxID=2865671 RepID=A0ABS7EXH3_9PROT|nr:hypothetical protein [Caldovatus aquaticus]MBW8268068.1 hypothetical protein [Caldovatus aquaticus]